MLKSAATESLSLPTGLQVPEDIGEVPVTVEDLGAVTKAIQSLVDGLASIQDFPPVFGHQDPRLVLAALANQWRHILIEGVVIRMARNGEDPLEISKATGMDLALVARIINGKLARRAFPMLTGGLYRDGGAL